MSKPVSPMAIGGFFVGAVALIVIGILVFGGREFLKPKLQLVVFFESSLNGLNVGAPVKMQGIKVGSVKELVLQLDDSRSKVRKPVVIEIEPSAFVDAENKPLPVVSVRQRKKTVQHLIDRGLKARLELQSLLTGLLYVDLDFFPDAPVKITGIDYRGLMELPSMPTRTDVVTDAMDQVISEIRELPLREIVTDLSGTLAEVRKIMTSSETEKTRVALAEAAAEARDAMNKLNDSMEPILRNLQGTLKETRTTVKALRDDIRPVASATEETMQAATAALAKAQGAFDAVESIAGPDSRLEEALEELRDAAMAVRNLSDYLERNPDALIYGKQ